jgi:hypothetical protein
MNTLVQKKVAEMINSQIAHAVMRGQDSPTRVLMDFTIWDEIVFENLPNSHPGPGRADQPLTFMGLEVIRTWDKEGIVEVLP